MPEFEATLILTVRVYSANHITSQLQLERLAESIRERLSDDELPMFVETVEVNSWWPAQPSTPTTRRT